MKCRYRLIIGLAFSCVLAPAAAPLAQPAGPDALLGLADAFYECGNYEASITEYLRFVCFEPDDPRLFRAYYQTALAYRAMGNESYAVPYFERAASLAPESVLEREIRFQLATAHLSLRHFDLAKIELFRLMSDRDGGDRTNEAALLLGLVHCTEGAWDRARVCFASIRIDAARSAPCRETLAAMDSVLVELGNHPRAKSPTLAKWMSTFLPGSGQAYAGNIPSGLNALALNALTTYALLDLAAGRHVRDTILFFTFIWFRYYQGNRVRAEAAAETANDEYLEAGVRHLSALARSANRAMAGDPLAAPR